MHNRDTTMKGTTMTIAVKRMALASCTLLLAALLAGCNSGASEKTVVVPEGESTPTITVTASSEVKVVPDKAEIGLSVVTQAATAEATQDANATSVNAVIDALKGLGVDEKSVQTTNTWLNPRYDYSETYHGESASTAVEAEPAAEPLEGEQSSEATAESTTAGASDAASDTEVMPMADTASAESSETNIVGYEMTTRLSVTDLDIDRVGEVVSACIAAGANSTDGIQYYSSEYDAKYAEALAAAVEDAHAKAEVLAKAGGVNLGGVYSMTEGYQDMSYRYNADGAMAMESAADASMKVMPGQIDVNASVTVSYEVS